MSIFSIISDHTTERDIAALAAGIKAASNHNADGQRFCRAAADSLILVRALQRIFDAQRAWAHAPEGADEARALGALQEAITAARSVVDVATGRSLPERQSLSA